MGDAAREGEAAVSRVEDVGGAAAPAAGSSGGQQEPKEAQTDAAAAEPAGGEYRYVDGGPAGARNLWPEGLPPSIHVDFAEIHCGFEEKKGIGYIKICCVDHEVTEVGLGQMLDYIDNWTQTPAAASGFGVTYDLRALPAPSIALLQKLAAWGAHPDREVKWKALNRACKVVINSGVRFTVCRGILNTFFWVCPPIVHTYLLTDPDEPEDTACVFEPGPLPGSAVADAAKSAEAAPAVPEAGGGWFSSWWAGGDPAKAEEAAGQEDKITAPDASTEHTNGAVITTAQDAEIKQ